MSGSNDPRVVFTKTVFRSFSGQNIPWTLRIFVFLLLPFFLLFVLGVVLLGFCILATTLLVQGLRSVVFGVPTANIRVARNRVFTSTSQTLSGSGPTSGEVIDILPEPKE